MRRRRGHAAGRRGAHGVIGGPGLIDGHETEKIHQREQIPVSVLPASGRCRWACRDRTCDRDPGYVPSRSDKAGATLPRSSLALPPSPRDQMEGGFQQVEVPLGGVKLVPLHLHGRVEDQAPWCRSRRRDQPGGRSTKFNPCR